MKENEGEAQLFAIEGNGFKCCTNGFKLSGRCCCGPFWGRPLQQFECVQKDYVGQVPTLVLQLSSSSSPTRACKYLLNFN